MNGVHRISIHAPRVGCDLGGGSISKMLEQFQSTHPVWGATELRPASALRIFYFNPRTPCGVRLLPQELDTELLEFQSTHPVWGAT